MESIKILIVEDEILIAEDLKDNLLSFGLKKIEMAHDKIEAMKTIRETNPDLILLDIRMENETAGIEIGDYISKNIHKPFIYITAHSDVQMIKEILKTKPNGYITKPIKKSDLFAAINLVISQQKRNEDNFLRIKDGYATVLINSLSILYIESDGNYINIFCEDKKHVSRQSLDSVINDLNKDNFYRIHRSYLVNVSQIMKFSKKEVQIGKVTLPVSRNEGDNFENFMQTKKLIN